MQNEMEQLRGEVILTPEPPPQGFRVVGSEACLVHRAELNRAFNEFRLRHYTHSLETLTRLMKNLTPISDKVTGDDERFYVSLQLLQASTITLLGRVHERLPDYKRSKREFRQAVDLFRQVTEAVEHWTPQDYNNYGIALERIGRTKQAVTTLMQGKSVLDPEALRIIGVGLQEKEKHAEALEYLSKAIDVDPYEAQLHRILAESLTSLGRNAEAATSYRTAAATQAIVGSTDDALSLLEIALSLNPSDPETLAVKGEVLRVKGDYREALDYLNRSLEIAPQSSSVMGIKGQTLRSLGEHESAVKVLRSALELDPGLDWVYAELGAALLSLGRSAEALEALENGLKIKPGDAFALGLRGQALRLLGQNERASQDLNHAVRLDPTLYWAVAELGLALIADGLPDEAIPVLDKAIARQPGNLSLLLAVKGEALSAYGRYQEALEALEESLRLDPDNAFALGKKGQVLRVLGRQEEAIEVLQRALDIDSTLHWVLEQLCYALGYASRYEQAIEVANKALERDPDDEFAWRFKGEILRLQKQFEPSLEALERALKIAPRNAWTLGTKGQVLRALGRSAEAITHFKDALKLAPDLDWLHGELGFAYYLSENYEEALRELNLSLEKGFRPILVRIRGNLLCDIAEFEAAAEQMERAISYNPNDASFFGLKGFALESLEGRAREALEAYKRAAKIEPENPIYQMGIGNAWYLLRRFDSAEKKYALALKHVNNMIEDDNVRCSIAGWCHHRLGNYEESIRHFKDALTLYPEGLSDHLNLALTLMCDKRYGLAIREYELSIQNIRSKPLLRQRGLLYTAFDDIKVEIDRKRIAISNKEAQRAFEMLSNELTRTKELIQEKK